LMSTILPFLTANSMSSHKHPQTGQVTALTVGMRILPELLL